MFISTKVIIQARMGSTRFPGKALAHISDLPCIIQQCRALNRCGINNIIIATSTLKRDEELVEILASEKIDFYRGDEADVLSRFIAIAQMSQEHTFIRLTGDNPVICPSALRFILSSHEDSDADLTSTREIHQREVKRYIPKGWSIDVLSRKALLSNSLSSSQDPFDREHVIPYFFKNPEYKLNIIKSFSKLDLPELSIDTPEDLVELQDQIDQDGSIDQFINKYDQIIKNYLQIQKSE